MTLHKLTKRCGISAELIAEKVDASVRILQYYFATGNMPYVVVWRLSKATGVPINEIVPESLAMMWDEFIKDRNATRGKRGRRAITIPEPIATEKPKEKTLKQRVDAVPPVPRETPKEKGGRTFGSGIPKSVTPIIPETVTPAKQPRKGKSIAEIMAASAPAPAPDEGPAPDFSKVDDSLFDTSMADNPVKGKKR